MTVTLRPLIPEDVVAVQQQPMQAREPEAVDLDYGRFVATGDAWTAENDGRIIGCGGLVEIEPGTAVAWAVLSAGIGAGMVAITRRARASIAGSRWPRVVALANADWPEAVAWAAMLGLQRVGVIPWGQNAEPHIFWEKLA